MTIYNESIRRTQARLRRELFLGCGKHTGRPYYLTPEQYLRTHMQLIGASDFGKSFYLEHTLQEFTHLHIPASLLDPKGDHAQSYYNFLQRNPRLRRGRRVIFFKPGSRAHRVGLDPFRAGLPAAETAGLMLEALMKVWGAETFNQTPRLERILRNMFHMFAANRIPLTQAYQFLLVANRSYREGLLTAVNNEKVRASQMEFERFPLSEKIERFESSWNRLQRFLDIPAVADMFAAEETSLDFNEIFDRQQIIVGDLSLLRTTEAQSLVGTTLVNMLYNAAKRRPQNRRSPWVLAIDEFPQFVTTDLARSLDLLRSFGIRLILAHQRLTQMPPDLLSAVMTNAKIKAIFGGTEGPDAERLARELFRGELRVDRPKYINVQTKLRPYLVERQVESFSESESEGGSESNGWTNGSSSGRNDAWSDGRSFRFGDDVTDETVTSTFSGGMSYGDSSSASNSNSRSRSRAQGHAWGTQFVTEHEEFQEETSRQFWSLDEQWEQLTARIVNLEKREVLVKAYNQPVVDITTPDVKHLPTRRQLRRKKPSPAPRTPPALPPTDPNALPTDFHE